MRTQLRLVGWGVVPAAVAILAGCQSYDASPLALGDHRASVRTRLVDPGSIESVEAFVSRLGAPSPAVARFDATDGLTLAEAEVVALFYNSDLRLARLDAGVSLAAFETAGLWEDPVFGFDGADILSAASPFEFGLNLAFTIPISGRLRVAEDRASAAYDASIARIVDAEWETRIRVRRAWVAWSAARLRLRVLDETVDRLDAVLAATDALIDAGELSRVDGRLIGLERSERSAARSLALMEVERARLALLRLLGLSPETSVVLVPSDSVVGGDVSVPDRAGRLIERNTSLAVRRAEYRVAEESLRLEIRKQIPDLTVGAGYGQEGDDRLLLGASIPVPVLNGNRGAIEEARARRAVARAMAETAFDGLLHDLAMADALRRGAEAQLDGFEGALLPALAAQASELETLIGLGELDAIVLLETVTREAAAKSRALELRAAAAEAWLEVVRLLGPDGPVRAAPVSGDRVSAGETPAEGIER